MWNNASNWGTTRAWRTADGIHFFGTAFVCGMFPKVRLASTQPIYDIATAARRSDVILNPIPLVQTVHASPDSSTLVLGLDDRRAVSFCAMVESSQKSQVEFFIPWTRRGAVTLHTSTGDIHLEDVTSFITVMQDSSFSAYSLNISGGVLVSEAYTLDPKGAVTRRLGGPYVDTTAPHLTAILPPDSLAIALAILQSPAVRHPAPLVRELVTAKTDTGNSVLILCKTYGADIQRSVDYADNTSSSPSWSPSSCAIPPMSWEPMNRLDAMLKALFPAKQNPPGVFLM